MKTKSKWVKKKEMRRKKAENSRGGFDQKGRSREDGKRGGGVLNHFH